MGASRFLGIFRSIIVLTIVMFIVGCGGGGGGGSDNGSSNDSNNSSNDNNPEASANGTWVSQGYESLSFTITSLSEPIVSNVGGTIIMPEGKGEIFMRNLVVAFILILSFAFGCAYRFTPIDIGHVQSNVVKGKTTMGEIEKAYGAPYNKGLTDSGATYYYYLSINPITAGSQDFTFYFDKKGRVSKYSTEYPGGNPLLK